jgi:hypothetical protein
MNVAAINKVIVSFDLRASIDFLPCFRKDDYVIGCIDFAGWVGLGKFRDYSDSANFALPAVACETVWVVWDDRG